MKFNRPRLRTVVAVAVATVASAALAACGKPAESTSGGSVDTAGLEKARAMVASGKQRPTKIPITEPITKKIPTGKRVVFIGCGAPTCNLEAAIIKQATDKLGWTLETVSTDGTPEKTKAVWQSILRGKPDGVMYTGTDRSVFDAELKQAEAAGIAVAACCVTDTPGNGIDYVIGKPSENATVAKPLAALTVTETDGKANAVYVDVPALRILTSQAESYTATMKEFCPSCSVDKLDLPVTALGKDVPDRVVSYLRSHPKVNALVFGVDGIGTGVPQAMKAAGLKDLVYIGTGPDTVTLQNIGAGLRGPTVAFPYYEEMFALVDGLARDFSGTPAITKDVELPVWIITKDNLVTDKELYPLVEDVKGQYFKLWGVA